MASLTRIFSVGPVTSWGKTFLESLAPQIAADVVSEPSVDAFCGAGGTQPVCVLVEHGPDARALVGKMRQSGRPVLIGIFGKLFSKEDISFALENRVHALLEGTKADDARVVAAAQRMMRAVQDAEQFRQRMHSAKRLLLEAETSGEGLVPAGEMKTALAKIESSAPQGEFFTEASLESQTTDDRLLLPQSEEFGDALLTIHDLERTGVLWVRGNLAAQEGKVEFLQGKIVAATAGGVHGQKALYRMFLWDEPKLVFHRMKPENYVIEEHLNVSLQTLRVEGDDLRARYQQLRRDLPPLDLRLELEPTALHVGTQLLPDDFSTLCSVVEFGAVRHILDYNDLPDVTLYEALIRLRRGNLIRVAA